MGWFKARRRFAIGHFQGDVYGLSYMQKWLREQHLTREAGVIMSQNITDENFGIPEPLAYKQLIAVKDWRTAHKKVQHRDAMLEKRRLQALES